MPKLGDIVESKAQPVDPVISEVSLMTQLIKERQDPLALLRELISNAASAEVGARSIGITYTKDREGHVFEVEDDGCGMDYTGDKNLPGRLDRFLGLGLSSVIGIRGDEFSWKGLGSKFAYQSCRMEIETWTGRNDFIRVEVNEPWESISQKRIPKPRLYRSSPPDGRRPGTRVRVIGHPPHRQEERPWTREEIVSYLTHRTFVGFTHERRSPPKVTLSVFGDTSEIAVGFPEIRGLTPADGTLLIDESERAVRPGTNISVAVRLHGFATWDDRDHGLAPESLNTGLVLSVQGIPYFTLPMKDFGSRSLATATPGEGKCCLLVECNDVREDLNIGRSALVDSPKAQLLQQAVAKALARVEESEAYRAFRQVPKTRKHIAGAGKLGVTRADLEKDTQRWVVCRHEDGHATVLLREPTNENDVLLLLAKLAALELLPFEQFEILGHGGTGPDLLVHFQETNVTPVERCAVIEVESRFANYVAHGHIPAQYARVVCWELSTKRRMDVKQTNNTYKFTADAGDFTVHIFCLRRMANIEVLTTKDLRDQALR
jgi:hypothetical protein